VRNDLIQWLQHLRNNIGFDGWRFDFVRGYNGQYAKIYTDATVRGRQGLGGWRVFVCRRREWVGGGGGGGGGGGRRLVLGEQEGGGRAASLCVCVGDGDGGEGGGADGGTGGLCRT
jgi:hypothetical protein